MVSFTLFLLFVYLTHTVTPTAVPTHSNDVAEWFWWSTLSLKRSIYYSLSMIFFFLSLGLCICGILQEKKKVEHIKL
jgi:hypothetical protein